MNARAVRVAAKAANLAELPLELADVPLPALAPGEVLVKVLPPG